MCILQYSWFIETKLFQITVVAHITIIASKLLNIYIYIFVLIQQQHKADLGFMK